MCFWLSDYPGKIDHFVRNLFLARSKVKYLQMRGRPPSYEDKY